MFGLLVLILFVINCNASYYTDGIRKIDVDDVIEVITKYDKTFVHDINQPYSQHEIEKNGLVWVCFDHKGDMCPECIPMGDILCMDDKGVTYDALYGSKQDSKCICNLMYREAIPTYVLYTRDGSDHYWNSIEIVITQDKQQNYPSNMMEDTYNCSALPEGVLQEKCFIDEIPNYKLINHDKLLNLTFELLDMDPDLWHVEVDRIHGKIIIYYNTMNELSTFNNKLEYTLEMFPSRFSTNYSSHDNIVFEIPDIAFWRNLTMNWTIYTNEQWILGRYLLKQGTVVWYADGSYLENEFRHDECTLKCGAFCYNNFHCMTDKQKNVKMAGILILFLNVLVGNAFFSYVWWDQRKKIKAKGTNSNFVKVFLCITVVSLAIPTADAWGTCVSTPLIQSNVTVHTDGIDSIVWTGQVNLANINGQACFGIASPNDANDMRIKAILEIQKAELIYTLRPQYSTYLYELHQPPAYTECPGLFSCNTIQCNGRCDTDRTCGDKLAINTDLPGRSKCGDTLPLHSGCFNNWGFLTSALCSRMMKLVGYELRPLEWFTVLRMDSQPVLRINLKITLDYLNGTQEITERVFDAENPNSVTPIFTIGDTKFYNSGISHTSEVPIESVMLSFTQFFMRSMDLNIKSYLVDASPVGTKVKNTIGQLQCRVFERDMCDAPDDICSIDLSATGSETICDLDPIRTVLNSSDKELPLVKNGNNYELSKDLTTMKVKLSKIGNIQLTINGNTELQSETATVVPECSLLGVANGCFMCAAGFWFKVNATSKFDSGKAIVSISHADPSNTNELGIFNAIIGLTTTYQEIDIHGFTQSEKNDLIVRISSGDNHCEFPLLFEAYFDDRTVIANRTVLDIEPEYENSNGIGDLFNGVGDFFNDVGGFVGDFFDGIFSGPFAWIIETVIVIAVIMLIVSVCGPCLGQIISGCIQGGKGCCVGRTTANGYESLSSLFDSRNVQN